MLGPDITEQRSWSHSHAGQLGPFQHVQMSQECAELGTTSLFPSPPPTPHPLICLLKLCLHSTLFHLSLGGPLAHCPSGPLLQSSSSQDHGRGSLSAGALLFLQTLGADHVEMGA